MIVTIQEYQSYLPNTDDFFDPNKMAAFEIRALYKYFPKYIGDNLTASIEGVNPNAGLLAKVKPALACLAVLESIPFVDLVATNNGFAIVSNQNLAPASRERVQALRDGCLVAANAYFDRLLAYLESNQSTFTTWNKSCVNTGSLLPGVTEFIAATKQHIDRHSFVDMIPIISAIEKTVFKNELSAEFLTELVAGSDTAVKPVLRQALAFKALAKSLMDPKDGEIVKANRYSGLGAQYMSNALAYLVANLDTYTTYETHGYEAPFDNDTAADEDGEQYGFFVMGTPCR